MGGGNSCQSEKASIAMRAIEKSEYIFGKYTPSLSVPDALCARVHRADVLVSESRNEEGLWGLVHVRLLDSTDKQAAREARRKNKPVFGRMHPACLNMS